MTKHNLANEKNTIPLEKIIEKAVNENGVINLTTDVLDEIRKLDMNKTEGRLRDLIGDLLVDNIHNSQVRLRQAIQAVKEGASVHQTSRKIKEYLDYLQALIISVYNDKITKLLGLSEKSSIQMSEYEVVDRLLNYWVRFYESKPITDIINGEVIIVLLLSSLLRFLKDPFIQNLIFNKHFNQKNPLEIKYMEKAYKVRGYYLSNDESKL